MKTLLMALVMVATTNAMAAEKIQNCFTAKNVKKGQFIVQMNENLSFNESSQVGHQMGLLGLAQMGAGGSSLLLVESAYPMDELSRSQQATILDGLQKLLNSGALESVTCNGLMKAL